MNTSELVMPTHLNRKAIIYIRQSTSHQVLSNQESLHLQYALRQRAIDLGWSEDQIEIIDCDLGQTAATITHRKGFKELLAQVTLGEVGIVLSYDVTRLSRNCSDWYPLLDICGYRNCLIADRDGVYDPGSSNGRLLLGLKGQISELELHTIQARLTAGILNKAKRGELALTLPTGLVRDELGVVAKDPNLEVQERIALVFEIFLQLRAAHSVLHTLIAQNLLLPRCNHFHEVVWRKPTTSSILSILKNPAYAGAFVYGRTRSVRQSHDLHQTKVQYLAMNEWKIRVNDQYPAYISWETFEEIQAQLKDNHAEYLHKKSRGTPREGAALLQGIVYCGECGHKMTMQYKKCIRYLCGALRQHYGSEPTCQLIPTNIVDQHVVSSFFEALAPVELDAYSHAVQSVQQTDGAIERAQQQQLERLRYRVSLAERQFNQVDPDNRLVASELEKRWENALAELRQAQQDYTQKQRSQPASDLPSELKYAFTEIGKNLPKIWDNSILSFSQKKSLLRCLIDKVVVHHICRDTIRVRVVWRGGETTTTELPIPVNSMAELTNAKELETRIVELARQGMDDVSIAQKLTTEKFRSPMHLTVLPGTVQRIRLQYNVMANPNLSHQRKVTGYLTIRQIATELQLPIHWIYDRIYKGAVVVTRDPTTNLFLFPDQPSTLADFKRLREGTIKTLSFL